MEVRVKRKDSSIQWDNTVGGCVQLRRLCRLLPLCFGSFLLICGAAGGQSGTLVVVLFLQHTQQPLVLCLLVCFSREGGLFPVSLRPCPLHKLDKENLSSGFLRFTLLSIPRIHSSAVHSFLQGNFSPQTRATPSPSLFHSSVTKLERERRPP